MTRLSTLCLAAIALCPAVPAVAQTHHPATPDKGEVRIIFSDDKNRTDTVDVYRIFVENAPKRFDLPGAPRFAIEGKDSKFYLGIGGNVKATASYDWGNPIRNAFNFTTSSIPMDQLPGNGGLLQLSAATSNIFMNFVAMPGDKNQLGAYINANFTGQNYGFSLQYAYLTFRGFTAGYNYSLFTDLASCPPTIDHEGPCSFTLNPNTVIDYVHNFSKHLSVAAGAELPRVSATTDKQSYIVNQRIPDIPAYIQYIWGKNQSRVRLSVLFRNMLYHTDIAECNHNVFGWGIKLSGNTSIVPGLTAYYQAAYGRGITSYFQDLSNGTLDMVPDPNKPGHLKAVKAWGGYLGLQYNFSPKVFSTVTYGHLRNNAPCYEGGSAAWPQQYRYAQYALGNVFVKLTPIVTWGVEYIWGRRVDMDNLSRHDNRLQTMLQVSF